MVLVVGAALLIRTFRDLQTVDPGFDTHNVLTMAMSINADRFQTTVGVARISVTAPSVSPGCPASPALPPPAAFRCRVALARLFTSLAAQRATTLPQAEPYLHRVVRATSIHSKFRSCSGRNFTEHDDGSAPGVVIINEAMAKEYWPKGDPLVGPPAHRRRHGSCFAEPPRQIIGSPATCGMTASISDPAPTMYIPYRSDARQSYRAQLPRCAVEVDRPQPRRAHALSQAHGRALREATGGLPVGHVRTMDEVAVQPSRGSASTCCC